MSDPRNTVTLRRTVIAACFFALLTACGDNLGREELLERARGALAEGKANSAEIDVKTALQQAPGDPAGRRLYGEILLYQRNLPEANEQFRRLLDTAFDPTVAIIYARTLVDSGEHQQLVELIKGGFFDAVADDPAFLAERARAEAADGDYFAAVDTLDQAEAIDAALPAVRRARAVVLAQEGGDMEAGLRILEELVVQYPDDADAWSFQAYILQAQGNLSEAERAFARAGEINPYRLPDRLNHLMLLIEQEKYDESKAVIEQLDQLMPKNPGVNYAQARLAMQAGNPGKAIEELDEVLQVSPKHGASLYLAANANLQRGNLATARSKIESFLAQSPNNTNGLLMLASIDLREGQTAKALDVSRQVLEAQPENKMARLLFARTQAAEGHFDASAATYADIVAADPQSTSLRAEYSEALLRAGETERSVAQLEEALELAPQDAALLTRLINTRIGLGDTQAARGDIAAFSAAFPESPEPELLLAKASLTEHDTEGARRHLQTALALDPGNASARRGLAGLAMIDADPDSAAAVLSEDLDQDEPSLQNLLSLAAVEERRGNLEAMERALRHAIEAYPEELTPRLLLARMAMRDGRPGEAVDLLTTVRERYDNDPGLQGLLVGAYIELDQPGPAVNAGRKLVALAPADPVALRLAARAERLAGSLAESEKLARKAVSLKPSDMATRKLLIELLIIQGNTKGTGEELELANEAFTEEQLIGFARGRRFALDVGDKVAAEALLLRAHEQKPNSVSLLFLTAALIVNGKVDESVDMLEAWIKSHPKDGVILNQIGALHAVRGEDDKAAEAYEKFIALYPGDVMATNNLAWSLRKSDPKQALKLVDSALEQAPGSTPILDTKAIVQMYAGDFDAALATLEQVAEKLGETPAVAYNRAQILIAAGRKDQARAVLQKLVEAEPFPEQERAKALLDSL